MLITALVIINAGVSFLHGFNFVWIATAPAIFLAFPVIIIATVWLLYFSIKGMIRGIKARRFAKTLTDEANQKVLTRKANYLLMISIISLLILISMA